VAGPYAVVAWMGFDRDKALGLTGSQAALPIWARFVADAGIDGAAPTAPEGMVQVEICATTGAAACPDCADRYTEWFPAAGAPAAAACGGAGLLGALFGGEAPPADPAGAAPAEGAAGTPPADAPAEDTRSEWQKLGDLFKRASP
jgi:hypothetical protein